MYSWTESECQQLWGDILRAGRNDETPAHFVGSVVYIEKGLYHLSSQAPLLVIDGQQRLTTVSLILEALARNVGDAEPLDGFSAKKIRNYYLRDPVQDGERQFKLLLTKGDRESLLALLQGKPLPEAVSSRVRDNFEFFEARVNGLDEAGVLALCKGLSKLVIVDVSLDRDQDNPQLIFESMNSTGRELSQADLIRNFVLMGLEPKHQTELYEDYWHPMEKAFGRDAYDAHFDSFMRHFLTLKTGSIPRVKDVYDAFKAYARSPGVRAVGVDALVADVHRFATHYCAMALDKETDPELRRAFHDVRELKVEVAYPFLLELYEDCTRGLLEEADLLKAVRLVESYVFRRAVCAIPTNSLNKTFATLSRSVDKDLYLESIKAQLLLLPSYRRFPRDKEFEQQVKTRDLYNFRNRRYWLRRLENHNRKEYVPVEEYTIEHILPQNEHLSKEWQEALGPNWQEAQETWLHTLGNLTLTGYNSEYSDRSFGEKRDMEGGFKHSPLRVNEFLGNIDIWNVDAITERAKRLARFAAQVWPAPDLPQKVLDGYRDTPTSSQSYTLDYHSQLAPGTGSRKLFDTLREEVLALDENVTEDIRKVYIAFKAETNFVDVVPQVNRLRLYLNMPFVDLNDPRGVANDVAGKGRWGNGEVEIPFDSIDDLPYVMALVRQSFERQMGDAIVAE